MTVPQNLFIPYGRQTITEADIDAVVNVLRSSFLTGPDGPCIRGELAEKVGALHGVAVNSATSASILPARLSDKPGDRLWTSPITFASANCGRYCGPKSNLLIMNRD